MSGNGSNVSNEDLGNYTVLKYCEITPGISTVGKVIEGKVLNKCPLQTTQKRKSLKIIISEEETDTSLCVFLFDKYAEQCLAVKTGDKILLSNVTVEKSTKHTQHQCQIIVDPVDNAAVIKIKQVTTACTKNMFVSSFGDCAPSSSNTISKNTSKVSKVALSKQYSYTLLKDVKARSTVNVYGVVKFMRKPLQSRGTDFMMIVSIIDDSFHDEQDKLKCILFNKDLHQFPTIKHIGQIVRFHRLSVNEFRDEPQGQNGPGFAWLVFGGNPDDSFEPVAASSNFYSITDWDKKKISSLREWRNEELNLSQDETQRISTLSQVTCGAYMDLTCQVIGKVLLKPKALLMLVWDGTKVNLPVMKENLVDSNFNENIDNHLFAHAGSCLYHLKLFDEHVESASDVQPGDFIVLRNLHAAKYRPEGVTDSSTLLPTIEFCLHTGTTYNRGLEILSESNKEVKQLKLILDEIPLPNNYKQQVATLEKKRQNNNKDDEIINEIRLAVTEGRNPGARRSRDNPCNPVPVTSSSTQGSDMRCMQTAATIITDHNHVNISTLKDILSGKSPHKYRVRAKVISLQPNADNVETFLKLYCPSCNYLCSLEEFKDKEPVSIINHVRNYGCPRCRLLKDKTQSNSIKTLEYIYMLQMILQDKTGHVMAQLWRNQAVKFFDDIDPRRLLKNQTLFTEISAGLMKLQGINYRLDDNKIVHCDSNSKTDEPPWMECCLLSYSTEFGKCYQIFDTVLCMDELNS